MPALPHPFHIFPLKNAALQHGTIQQFTGRALKARRARHDLTFIPFRITDSSDLVQIVCKFPLKQTIKPWSSLLVEGAVKLISNNLSKKWEIVVESPNGVTVVNSCEAALPWWLDDSDNVSQLLKSQNRDYLISTSTTLRRNIKLRSKITHAIRVHLHDQDWDEISTPVLVQPSEGGAREFLVLVPDKRGQVYALQQSPQQQKQLLIASSFTSRYFQIAKCFRAESGRADRQPEFEQIDLEIGFVSGRPSDDDRLSGWNMGGAQVRFAVEGLIRAIFKAFRNFEVQEIPVFTYGEAMSRWGTDKPDCRFGLELQTHRASDNTVIQSLVYESPAGNPCSFLTDFLLRHPEVEYHMNGMQHTFTSKFPTRSSTGGLQRSQEIHFEGSVTPLGTFRLALASELASRGLITKLETPRLLWITEFPLFTFDSELQKWQSTHHPFTAPMLEDVDSLQAGAFGSVRGQHYDLVLDGMELGGGSVRIHEPDMQLSILQKVLKWTEEDMNSIEHLLTALSRGAPPHGGFAFGLDRLIASVLGTEQISQVIAFPKSTGGIDHLLRCPVPLTEANMTDAGISRRPGTNS